MSDKRLVPMEGAKLQSVRIKDLQVHPRVQRKFRESRARRLLAEFDPARLTPLVVNREGGRLLVYEGQHRLWAITHWLNGGTETQELPCWVREGASDKDLAADRLATDSQMKMTPIDRFLMAVLAEEPEALAIRGVLTKYGLAVKQSAGNGVVQCVGACHRIVGRPGGVKMLERVIGLLSGAFGKTAEAYHRDLVGALGLIVFKFGAALDDDAMIRVLAKGQDGAPGWAAAGRQVAAGLGGGTQSGMITCLLRAYNKGRKKKLAFE